MFPMFQATFRIRIEMAITNRTFSRNIVYGSVDLRQLVRINAPK